MKYILLLMVAALAACSASQPPVLGASAGVINWHDGDNGDIGNFPFRLFSIDAGETGGIGAAIGGASCERERELGMQAKRFMERLTENSTLVVTNNYGPDRFGRNVVDISANGIDVAEAGLEAGVLRPWPHDINGNSLSEKPNWCIE